MNGGNTEMEGIAFAEMEHNLLQQHFLDDKYNKDTAKKDSPSFLSDEPIQLANLPKQIAELLWVASPNIATMMGVFYFNFMNMFFVRQIGDDVMVGSYGMGSTWYSATCLCFLISISSGLFIQLAQAYGAQNYKLMIDLYQRSQGILIAVGLISSIVMWNSKQILLFLGINLEIATYTEQFVTSLIPSIFGTVLFDTTKQLLIAQNIFDIPMKVQLFVYFFHPLWCYIFAFVFDGGLVGIGYARSVSEYLGYIILVLIIKKKNLISETWNFSYDFKIIFSNWIDFLKIALPVGSLVFLEWIFFEVQTILIGKLNNNAMLAGQVAYQSLVLFFFMTPLGLSWTTNSFLGNAVGEGNKKLCVQFSKLTMITCGVIAVFFIIIGELLESTFYGIFATDDTMGEYFSFAYNFYLYGFLIGDFFQVILNGILRCCDKQNFAAVAYFVVYYIFGIPCSVLLTFTFDLQLTGVWITQSLVATIVSIVFYYQVIKVDWDKAIYDVQLRVKKDQGNTTNNNQNDKEMQIIETANNFSDEANGINNNSGK